MRKHHGHTLLYLNETIALGTGSSDRFTEVFVDTYQPTMHDLGARTVELSMGLEQPAGGGLTCGPTGSSRRINSRRHRSLRRHLSISATARYCCGSWPPGSAAATCRPFAVCAADFRATTDAAAPKGTATRSMKSSGKSSPAAIPSTGPVIGW